MLIKIIFSALLLGGSLFLSGCPAGSQPRQDAEETAEKPNASSNKKTGNSTNVNPNDNAQKTSGASNDSACYNFKRDGMKLLKTQTFAIDFEPFKKACFVTFYGAEFSNPPLGAQFYIYKNGKEAFNFPEQFNGGNTLCWVDAVSFEDLNGDDLKDVIVVGKCGAKSDAYNENMVYINNGDEFVINKDSNMDLMDFTKTGEIKKYVQEHESKFSK